MLEPDDICALIVGAMPLEGVVSRGSELVIDGEPPRSKAVASMLQAARTSDHGKP